MDVFLDKRALPRSLDALPPRVAEDLLRLPASFGQQSLEAATGARLNLKKMAKPPGAWRLRCGDWRVIFFPTGEDFFVVAIGLRRDIYERFDRMRVARRRGGLTVIEAAATTAAADGPRAQASRTSRARRPAAPQPNPFSPFDDAMLSRIGGIGADELAFLRALPPTIDAPAVLAEWLADVDLAFLLADIWERPAHHLATFDAGSVPSLATLEIEEAELRARLTAPASETEVVAATTSRQILRLLDRSIEEWMIYLHPSQRAIANATFNGPARVRGGPGTGKTVVALHRARVLARRRIEAPDKVLLTTFLSTLPNVWTSLMGLLDDRALERMDVRNIDVVARELVATAHGGSIAILDPAERQKVVEPLLMRHDLAGPLAASAQLLLGEFDGFIAGRGIERLEDYLALRRRGGGSGLGRNERERVWAAFTDYRDAMRKREAWDWPQIRLAALRLAESGTGPRYNGVIVDEAQDLSAVGMRLLLALDVSESHKHFLIVGDGQQSIYPGGFGLREIGVDIVGRSRVLTANWRNTWSVWTAARAIMEGQAFDDLDGDVGLRPTGDEPEPLTVGAPAELHILRSPTEELELLGALVQERIDAGTHPGDIAILVEVRRKGEDAARALAAANIPTVKLERYEGEHADGVLIGTFNRSKGLEFKEVFLPGLAAAEWPSRWFVPPELKGDQRAERLSLQLRTLFVGMSRARDRLTLLSGGPPCGPVEQARWALDVREY
jgi:mRNA-degrading endonuclease RelE of RelBE toxin-antitoxin system